MISSLALKCTRDRKIDHGVRPKPHLLRFRAELVHFQGTTSTFQLDKTKLTPLGSDISLDPQNIDYGPGQLLCCSVEVDLQLKSLYSSIKRACFSLMSLPLKDRSLLRLARLQNIKSKCVIHYYQGLRVNLDRTRKLLYGV